MIGVDCSELTGDEMLAVASAISERLEGTGVAIVKDDKILIDQMSKSKISIAVVLSVIDTTTCMLCACNQSKLRRRGFLLRAKGF